MQQPLLLDQSALATYLDCPRRFQLRYLQRLPWPASPLDRSQRAAVERGRQFHRLVEQSLLDLPIDTGSIADDVVRGWWQRFRDSEVILPEGTRWPEHRLTVPIGDHFLHGRFDLLILGEKNGRPHAELFDWKTSKPRTPAKLAEEWQTRLYLAMVTESGRALAPAANKPLSAEQVAITYWYAAEPHNPRRLAYSEAWHRENWAVIERLVAEITAADPGGVWQLTSDWARCRSCMYQAYCGRQEAGTAAFLAEEAEPYSSEVIRLLEPHTP